MPGGGSIIPGGKGKGGIPGGGSGPGGRGAVAPKPPGKPPPVAALPAGRHPEIPGGTMGGGSDWIQDVYSFCTIPTCDQYAITALFCMGFSVFPSWHEGPYNDDDGPTCCSRR